MLNEKLIPDLFYKELVTLGTFSSIAAGYSPATQNYTLSPADGYTPVMVSLANTYNAYVNLWYINLNGNVINWRCGNTYTSAVSSITIRVWVLYVKSSLIA